MAGWKKKRLIGFMVSAGVIFVAGIAAFVLFIVSAVTGLSGGNHSLSAPGTDRFDLEPGSYTVFHEVGGLVNGVVTGYVSLNGLSVTITGPDEENVPVETAKTSGTYNIGGRHGYSVLEFKTSKPGVYEVRAGFQGAEPDGPVLLVLVKDFFSRLMTKILAAVAIMLATFAVTVLLVILGILLSRVKEPQV